MFTSKAFIIAALCVAATTATSFGNCENGKPPKKLIVEGCESEPCDFHRGKDVIAKWDFETVNSAEMLKPKVLVTVLGETVQYDLPEKNACNSLENAYCPLDGGEDVTYNLKMPVKSYYPSVSLGLQFSLVDENDNVHVCFNLRAQVVN